MSLLRARSEDSKKRIPGLYRESGEIVWLWYSSDLKMLNGIVSMLAMVGMIIIIYETI